MAFSMNIYSVFQCELSREAAFLCVLLCGTPPSACIANVSPSPLNIELYRISSTFHQGSSYLVVVSCRFPLGPQCDGYLLAQLELVVGYEACKPQVFGRAPVILMVPISLHAMVPVHANTAWRRAFENHSQSYFVDEILSHAWSSDTSTRRRVSFP